MRILITGGSTREAIDQVRSWSNIFTGQTALALATELSGIGQVDLLSSNPQHLTWARDGLRVEPYVTHAQLRLLLQHKIHTDPPDVVVMAAAVSDYRPVGSFAVESRHKGDDGSETWVVRDVQRAKVSSEHRMLAVLGQPTEKLVDLFRGEWGYRGLLVKFKLEVGLDADQLARVADRARRASGADLVVANTLEMLEGPAASAWLADDSGGWRVTRRELPTALRTWIQSRLTISPTLSQTLKQP